MKNDEKNFTENFDLPLVEEQEYIRAKKNVTLHNFRKELESDFLRFVKYMWPEFIEGRHHKDMAEMFNALADDKVDRLIINMPPKTYEVRVRVLLLASVDDSKESKTKNYSNNSHRGSGCRLWT